MASTPSPLAAPVFAFPGRSWSEAIIATQSKWAQVSVFVLRLTLCSEGAAPLCKPWKLRSEHVRDHLIYILL